MTINPIERHAEDIRRIEATELPATVDELLQRAAVRYGDAEAVKIPGYTGSRLWSCAISPPMPPKLS